MLVKTASCPTLSIVSFSYKKRKKFFGGEEGAEHSVVTNKEYYTKWNKPDRNRQTKNDIILRICGIEKIKKKNIEAESRMEGTEGREAVDIGRCWPKGTKS